ncbi:PREDICTED: acidic leucine-rich nuclear phosphoprotein 32-related protein 1-like [Dinoponera quadriceps]|uniref:Acidic leucine-rich nuclear phosphoprotein 32-related protein 1-like n=1 Tax=Dinoponera quadriceps TaxID=609295 RepID=A0A6P3WMV4_DINQU|nr:PREDICTED: acidic leucine-rich nuclear phosphoprotein 32-related protein 1-like [Dinoponera quadriceps]
MRLSTIFELLLILLLVAFAAYGRVIDRNEVAHRRVVRTVDNSKQSDMSLSTMSLKQATDSVNRYCTCNENICNCCRDFHIPVVQLKGPGCASLQYLQGDNLAMQLSFGDNILTSTMVNGKSPRPVCVPLPGGFTKFCGRIYSIQRDAKNHFKACLGLELQSATELEASLRVSCFRFGPDGLKLRPAEPLPVVEAESTSEEEDDDDFFGLGADDDDDDDDDDEDDEDDRPSLNSVPNASGVDDAQEVDEEDDDDDLLGLGALLDIFTGDDDTTTKRPKVTTVAPLLQFTIPILTRPTTPIPLEDYELTTSGNNVLAEPSNNGEHEENGTQDDTKLEEEEGETETLDNEDTNNENQEEEVTEASNQIVFYAKPDKVGQLPQTNKVKKGVVGNKKKPTVTSTSINAIDEPEKPAKKPIKDEDDEDDDDDDDDDEDDILDDDDDDDEVLDDEYDKDDEDEEDEDKHEDDEKHEEFDDEDEKAEDLSDLDDDDDDEEEEAMLTAIMGSGKNSKNKGDTTNGSNEYDYSLGFLARKRHPGGNRQSKITRL